VWDWRDQLLAAPTPDSKFGILERLLSQGLLHNKLSQRHSDAVAWALDRYMASQIFRRLLLSQAELGLATNTLLICSGDKPACRQSCFAGFAGFRRCCSRFKHAQRLTGRMSHAVADILINPISSTTLTNSRA